MNRFHPSTVFNAPPANISLFRSAQVFGKVRQAYQDSAQDDREADRCLRIKKAGQYHSKNDSQNGAKN